MIYKNFPILFFESIDKIFWTGYTLLVMMNVMERSPRGRNNQMQCIYSERENAEALVRCARMMHGEDN